MAKTKEKTQTKAKKPVSPTAKRSAQVLQIEAKNRLPAKEKLPSKNKKTGVKKNKRYLETQIKISERRELALDLARTGLSIRQISKHLIAKGYKASPATVSLDLTEELKNLAEARVQKTELLVELELEKLDGWELSLNLDLKSPKPSLHPLEDKLNIIYALLKIQDRRDKFQTLSKREKSKIDAREALAKLMGVDPNRLPNPDEK